MPKRKTRRVAPSRPAPLASRRRGDRGRRIAALVLLAALLGAIVLPVISALLK